MYNPSQAADVIAGLLQSRTVAHALHLQTRSYAKHMALGEFYSAVGDMADGIAETMQGRYDLLPLDILAETEKNAGVDPAVAFLQGLASWLEDNRGCCTDTDVQNQFDEVASLIAKTLYKLRFLD